MRKGVVFFLVLLLLGIFFVPPASLFAQMILKKPLPLTQQNQATIASILPNTVILQQGGPAAIVTVDGKFLETVLAVKAIRNGQGVGEIAVKLVQPWPASRKIELQATATAPVAKGYQLRFIGKAGLTEFKVDVPVSVFSFEVVGKKMQQIQQTTLSSQPLTPKMPTVITKTPPIFHNAEIIAFKPQSVSLEKGGKPAIVIVEGRNLENVSSVQVIKADRGVREITAKLVQPWPASRKIELQAGVDAPVAKGYQLRAIGKIGTEEYKIDMPLAVFSLEVLAPSNELILTRIVPDSGEVGSEATIEGNGLLYARVDFNGCWNCENLNQSAQILEKTNTSLKVKIPRTAQTGKILVTSIKHVKSDFIFKVLRMPKIISFSPKSGPPGTIVKIRGYNLDQVKFFNEVYAMHTSGGDEGYTDLGMLEWGDFHVPAGATTGPIKAMTTDGTAFSSENFQTGTYLISPPSVTQIVPTNGNVGTEITISGKNFGEEVSGVMISFGRKQSPEPPSFCSNDTIRIKVPDNAETGKIKVKTSGGEAKSTETFWLPPMISSIVPNQAPIGYRLKINGKNFMANADWLLEVVKFNGVQAKNYGGFFQDLAGPDTYLDVEVPVGATSGYVTVKTPGGTE